MLEEDRSYSCRMLKASASPERGGGAGDTRLEKEKEGRYWLEETLVPGIPAARHL